MSKCFILSPTLILILLELSGCGNTSTPNGKSIPLGTTGSQSKPVKTGKPSSTEIPEPRSLLAGWEFSLPSGRMPGEFVLDRLDESKSPSLSVREILKSPGRHLSGTNQFIAVDSIVSIQRLQSAGDFLGRDTINGTIMVNGHATFETHDFHGKSTYEKVEILKSIISQDTNR